MIVCSKCGYQSIDWQATCPGCGWTTAKHMTDEEIKNESFYSSLEKYSDNYDEKNDRYFWGGLFFGLVVALALIVKDVEVVVAVVIGLIVSYVVKLILSFNTWTDPIEYAANTIQVPKDLATMSLEELFAANSEAETVWKFIISRYKNNDSHIERNLDKVAVIIKEIREAIRKRFQYVITDYSQAEKYAFKVASEDERIELKETKSERDSIGKEVYKLAVKYANIGNTSLRMEQHSIMRGIAASAIAGPIAGGLAYSTSESENQKISEQNVEAIRNSFELSKLRIEIDIVTERSKKIAEEYRQLVKKIIIKNDSGAIFYKYKVPDEELTKPYKKQN